jgi:hypothetical protein
MRSPTREWRGLEADFSARSSALRARARAPSALPDTSSSAASATPRCASTRGAVRLRSTRTCATTLQNQAAEWRREAAAPGLRPAGQRARTNGLIRWLTGGAATDRHFAVGGVDGGRRRKAGKCRSRTATSVRIPLGRARARACTKARRRASTRHGLPGATTPRCAARRGRWAVETLKKRSGAFPQRGAAVPTARGSPPRPCTNRVTRHGHEGWTMGGREGWEMGLTASGHRPATTHSTDVTEHRDGSTRSGP